MLIRKNSIISNQRGAGLALGFVLTLLFIICAALIVDIARLEIFLRNLQATVDSAALAGADAFDLSPCDSAYTDVDVTYNNGDFCISTTGHMLDKTQNKQLAWRNAKEAVFKALANSNLSTQFNTSFDVSSAIQDCTEPPLNGAAGSCSLGTSIDTGNWNWYQYDFGQLVVMVERGLYFKYGQVDGSNHPVLDAQGNQVFIVNFLSFENIPATTDVCGYSLVPSTVDPHSKLVSDLFPSRCSGAGSSRVPIWFANGVRAVVLLKSMPTMFARVAAVGLGQFVDAKSRSTISSRQVAVVPASTLVPSGTTPPDQW